MSRRKTEQLTLCGILISAALGLSYVERLLPLQMLIPLPGVKLGLANIVTMMALHFLGERDAFAILSIRCVLGAVLGGGISGLAFSLTGGLLALAVMSLARQMGIFSVYGVSILGAAAHHVGQICVAVFLINSVYIAGYLPYLLVVSMVTGTATGTICANVFRTLAAAGQIPGIRKKFMEEMKT